MRSPQAFWLPRGFGFKTLTSALAVELALCMAPARACHAASLARQAVAGLLAPAAIWQMSAVAAALGGLAFLDRGRRRARSLARRRPMPPPPPEVAAEHCPITFLPLRARMNAAIGGMIGKARPFGTLIIDIDHFRALRAAHGFAAGDRALLELADTLRRLAPPGTFVARIYGDEFAMLVPNADGVTLTALATEICAAAAAGAAPSFTVSIGGALSPRQGATREAILRAAALALAQAKNAGGNAIRLFEPGLAVAAEARASLRRDMPAALKAGQFVPYYQPIMELATGAVVGFEVLARWQHPTRGLIMPDDFISLAEEQKLCGALSGRLLAQVTQDARQWPAHWNFAFNGSPGQMRELAQLMDRAGEPPADILPASRMELEVTETVLIEDMALARRIADGLHAAGARVVLDDFGTGYANFNHLREIPFDRIKIDKCFVQNMLRDPRTEACVRAMLELARSLDISVVAEGVESQAAEQHLRALGCQFAQGYYYAQPMPARDVRAFSGRALSGMVAA